MYKLLIILLVQFSLMGISFGADEDCKEALSLGNALIQASKGGNLEEVKELIAEGVDVNYSDDEFGMTALMWAAFNGEIEIVKKLIEAGADVNLQDYTKRTALMYACIEGHADIVKVLIAAEADVTFKDHFNFTVLQYAKTEKIRQLLIDAGATEKVVPLQNKGFLLHLHHLYKKGKAS